MITNSIIIISPSLCETGSTCCAVLFCEDAETVVRQSQSQALKSVNNLQSGPSEDTVCLSGEGHQGCLIDLYSLFRPWLHTAQTFLLGNVNIMCL